MSIISTILYCIFYLQHDTYIILGAASLLTYIILGATSLLTYIILGAASLLTFTQFNHFLNNIWPTTVHLNSRNLSQ